MDGREVLCSGRSELEGRVVAHQKTGHIIEDNPGAVIDAKAVRL